MLKTTRDMIMPTTITGSYPRPLWFDRSLEGRSFKAALGDSLFREQYLDAVATLIAEQESAGVGIVTSEDSAAVGDEEPIWSGDVSGENGRTGAGRRSAAALESQTGVERNVARKRL